MYATSAVALAATLFASAGMAAPMTQRDYVSAPFNLTVTSHSGKYSNTPVAACHSGAAIEALCVYPDTSSEFTFNATDAAPVDADSTNPGSVVFTLPSQPEPYAQDLSFFKNSTSNVQAGFFGGYTEGPQQFAFTNLNQLAVIRSGTAEDFTWFVCPQTNLGYQYDTLSYVSPLDGAPDNADCEAVSVYRIF